MLDFGEVTGLKGRRGTGRDWRCKEERTSLKERQGTGRTGNVGREDLSEGEGIERKRDNIRRRGQA